MTGKHQALLEVQKYPVNGLENSEKQRQAAKAAFRRTSPETWSVLAPSTAEEEYATMSKACVMIILFGNFLESANETQEEQATAYSKLRIPLVQLH